MKYKSVHTNAIHAGEKQAKFCDALTVPIFQTATYVFKNTRDIERFGRKELAHYEYGRYGNPTQRAAEEKLAAMEGGEDCLLFASGMAAIATTLLAFLSKGDHIILTDDSYKKTFQFCVHELPRFGIETTIVKMGHYDELIKAVRKNTKIILTESPTNPYLNIADFSKLARIKKKIGGDILLIIDSTFGTPFNQKPLKWRCDLVFHSATKYLAGHNDILAGAVIGAHHLIEKIRMFQGATGGIIAPHCAYLLLRGLKTFPTRMERQNQSALQIAAWLEKRKDVIEKVYYPGLKSHHDHELAKLQMKGFGGVISFVISRPLRRVKQFLNALKLCAIAPSLGGVETLITHPACVSYYAYSKKERQKLGIVDGLIRLSVGLEDPQDIIHDLKRGLDRII
ncbi:MAG: PLP-dependent aspartate aminotransferase family protein [Candidatus Omnitrophica bacterium]|nr:PLP-dependent aspartate aminotransferase family protein [Candidatus Omnitrophota bacterium]MDD5670702.1 PLP-dependent aspartate aminotransferase family protein [Candidatus Omnitrophota bacterium]